MKTVTIRLILGLLGFGLAGMTQKTFGVDELIDPALQAKVDAQVKIIRVWAADPIIVNAVKAQNASLPAEYAAMTQEKWKAMSKLDPFVRSFDKNAAGEFLKSKKSDVVIRAFLSDAAGLKVGFTAKTLNWTHKGEPKHEVPMTGKTWQGPREQDRASGWEQIQISVPVLDGDKPIGSLVVSLSVAKL
jgi:hypothetical protein